MNSCFFIGRLTRDVEVRFTQSGKAVANFGIAVERKYKNPSGEKEVDFINCIIWEKKAEILAQYCGKGSQIAVLGSLQMEKYKSKDGADMTTWKVLVEQVQFLGSKGNGNNQQGYQQEYAPQDNNSDLPF